MSYIPVTVDVPATAEQVADVFRDRHAEPWVHAIWVDPIDGRTVVTFTPPQAGIAGHQIDRRPGRADRWTWEPHMPGRQRELAAAGFEPVGTGTILVAAVPEWSDRDMVLAAERMASFAAAADWLLGSLQETRDGAAHGR